PSRRKRAPAAGRWFFTYRSDGHDGECRRDFRAMAQRAGKTQRSADGHRRPGEFRGAAEVFGSGRKTQPRAQALATPLRGRNTCQLNLPHRKWLFLLRRLKTTAVSNLGLPTERRAVPSASKLLCQNATNPLRQPPPEAVAGRGGRSKHSANSPSA